MKTFKTALAKKRLENSHSSSQNRLFTSERLHRFLVDHSPDIIFTLDEQGRFSFINQSVENLLHHEPCTLLGSEFTHLVEASDSEKARYFLDSVLCDAREMEASPSCIRLQLWQAGTQNARKRYFDVTLSRVDDSAKLPGASAHRFEIHGTAREVTTQLEAEAFIHFQAYHDILTQLPNRSLFRDRVDTAITQAQRGRRKLAVLFIDLDRFKVINDSLGHTVGDRLLQAVSQRLQGCIRKADTLSRFGGDEFTLLLTDVASEEAALQVADKLLDKLGNPFHVRGHRIHIGASIGIALYPEGGRTLDHLIRSADAAMYRIKNNGKNGAVVFHNAVNDEITPRRSMEQGLRNVLQNC